MFQRLNLEGDLIDPRTQVEIRSVVDVFIAEAVARVIEFELGFKLCPLGIQAMEIDVIHLPASTVFLHLVENEHNRAKFQAVETVAQANAAIAALQALEK
jgi:hypothetical protein